MKSAVSRVVVAASVVATLGLTAACGGGDGGGDGGSGRDGRDGGKSSTSQAKPKGPGGDAGAGTGAGGAGAGGGADEDSPAARKLAASALTKGDLDRYDVHRKEITKGEAVSAGAPTKPSACRPLWDMLAAATPPNAKAHVGRTVTGKGTTNTSATDVQLFTYGGADDAKKALRDLRAAAKSKPCGSFRSPGLHFSGVATLPAPDRGDEAVAYKLGMREGEFLQRNTVTVVRKGATLVSFAASNQYDPESVASDKRSREESEGGPDIAGPDKADDEPRIPSAVLDVQLKKVK
ncbi:hypothetical protein [Streptomyces sp. NPDC059063]|uniref:hypothetical protein n=1 Tax=unclassified Streptomyces TaxID=2593676 RepID=UPI00368E39ED